MSLVRIWSYDVRRRIHNYRAAGIVMPVSLPVVKAGRITGPGVVAVAIGRRIVVPGRGVEPDADGTRTISAAVGVSASSADIAATVIVSAREVRPAGEASCPASGVGSS